MFRDLARNLRELEDRFGILRGTVRAEPRGEPWAAIVVVAYAGEPPQVRVADSIILPRPGPYFLLVPVGAHQVAAFEDRNGDRVLDSDEPVAALFDGHSVAVGGGQILDGLDLALRGDAPNDLGLAIAVPRDSVVGVDALPRPHLGEVTTLDDPRFSESAARSGLWRPVDFVFEIGAGVYFLEPYDPDRVPVVFIHGALGHPANWRYLVERLDRRRFQPWLVYYPTAARIGLIAAAIGQWLQSLDATYDARSPVLVAHSMGGLVARELLNQQLADVRDEIPDPIALVTISTPWLGHSAAALGVAQAPVVAPSWHDLAPGSPFLTNLLHEPLPAGVSFSLLFTYGGGSRWIGAPNDGVVTLASQLAPEAQQQAARVIGFDADHRSVLRNPAVADEVNRMLAAAVGDR